MVDSHSWPGHWASVSAANRSSSWHTAVGPLAGFLGSLVSGFLPGAVAGMLTRSLDDPLPFGLTLLVPTLIYVLTLLLFVASRRDDSAPVRQTRPTAHAAPSAEALPTEALPPQRGLRVLPVGLLLVALLFGALRYGGTFAMDTFFNAYADTDVHTPPHLIGIVVSLNRLIMAPVALLVAPRAILWMGTERVVLFGRLLTAPTLLSVALLPGLSVESGGELVENERGASNWAIEPSFVRSPVARKRSGLPSSSTFARSATRI